MDIPTSVDTIHVNTSWLGIPLDQLEPEHFQQILWELHEVNFRFKFCALDHCTRYSTPFKEDPEAENLLAACFPDSSFGFPTLDTANHGIASTFSS